MTLRTRLGLAFCLVTGVALVPGVVAVSRLAGLRELAVEGRSSHATAVTTLGRMQTLTAELDQLERSYIATADASLGVAAESRVDSLFQAFDRFRGLAYGSLGTSLGPVLQEVRDHARTVDVLIVGGDADGAGERFAPMVAALGRARRHYSALADTIDALADAELRRADALALAARNDTLLGIALALVLALLLAGVTTHRITAPLRRLGRAMARVADGTYEVARDLPSDRTDEVGELSTSFETMTRRLADLDRKKSEFLGIVGHELKTPINVINAYAEVLHDDLGNMSDYQAKMVSDICGQAQVMARLVSRLMDLSRLEAGAFPLQFETVRLRHLVSDLMSSYRRLAAEKGVELRARIDDAVPIESVLDEDIVRDEVLGNLVVNAIRYAPSGGWVEIALGTDDFGIHFTVSDSGPGVPAEHRQLIFEKHYSADRSRVVGSGLGLAIAREMVALHGGVISLAPDAPLRGACFRVALPLSPVPPSLETPASLLASKRTARSTAA